MTAERWQTPKWLRNLAALDGFRMRSVPMTRNQRRKRYLAREVRNLLGLHSLRAEFMPEAWPTSRRNNRWRPVWTIMHGKQMVAVVAVGAPFSHWQDAVEQVRSTWGLL